MRLLGCSLFELGRYRWQQFRPARAIATITVTCLAIGLGADAAIAQTPDQLEAQGVSIAKVTYDGKSAVRVDALPDAPNDEAYAILKGSHFNNGTIEVELAGKPAA